MSLRFAGLAAAFSLALGVGVPDVTAVSGGVGRIPISCQGAIQPWFESGKMFSQSAALTDPILLYSELGIRAFQPLHLSALRIYSATIILYTNSF